MRLGRNVFWTRQARDDLRAIRDHIARDAPATAVAFVRRLRKSVGRLREFPLSGQVVPKVGEDSIREILFGSYRLIYRVTESRVEMISVFHSVKILGSGEFD